MRVTGAVLFSIAIAVTFSAAGAENLELRMKGETSKSGKFVNVTVELGTGVTRGIRIVSEPSATALGLFETNSIEDEAQEAWKAKNSPGVKKVMSFPFNPNAKATLQMLRPPDSDRRLAVYVFGRWPGADVEEERRFVVTTNLNKFAFTYTFDAKSVIGRICCGDGLDGCARNCTSCAEEEYTCCTLQEYDAACGWCGKNKAYCGTQSCPC